MGFLLLSLLIVFIYTHALIYLSNAYAKRHLLQTPHDRSTHTKTIPRGVGLAVVIVCLIAIFALAINHVYFLPNIVYPLLFGGSLIALIGFFDDHQDVSPHIRLCVQAFGVGLVLYQMGGFPAFYILNHVFYIGWIGHIFAFIGMIWFVNLYNFFDGIDGQVGMETLFACFNVALMTYLLGFTSVTWLMLVLGSSMAAFLCWNWQPAKVFMGDVCSGFLGFLFAVLMAYTARDNTVPLLCWFILFALPIIDMSYTLVVRLLRGYRYYEPHNMQAFNHAVTRYGSHQAVVLRGLAINLFWLAPLTWAAFLWPQYDLYFFIVAVAPIFYIVVKLGAGKENDFTKILAPRDRFELPTK